MKNITIEMVYMPKDNRVLVLVNNSNTVQYDEIFNIEKLPEILLEYIKYEM